MLSIMKTFLNVLYRRILYKIPLKFLLILLALFAICFASFSNAEDSFNCWPVFVSAQNYTNNYNFSMNVAWSEFEWTDLYCFTNSSVNNWVKIKFNCQWDYISVAKLQSYCYYKSSWITSICWVLQSDWKIAWSYYDTACLDKPYTSLQCQTEYNLIPISSVDSNYCTTNNLCPSYDCPVNSGGTLSNVYINNILHVGAPNIVMNIPEEIDWDYAYTTWGQNMNIDIVGYNVDYEKMQSIIDQQNYKPSQEDFTNLISILGPYSKIIIFFVFIFIVWAWIKKPFKSKL